MVRRRSGSLLPTVGIAIFLLFATVLYVVVAGPTVGGTAQSINETGGEAIDDQNLRGEYEFTLDVFLLYIPLMLVFGVLAYIYAAVAGTESAGGRAR